MAAFYGDEREEAAQHYEAFMGDDLFGLDVQTSGGSVRRVMEADPFIGLDPTTLEPSLPPPVPSIQGLSPIRSSRPRPDPKYDCSYKMLLQRQEIERLEEESRQHHEVWGRLGESSSPNIIGKVCAEVCGAVCNGSCLTDHGCPYGSGPGEVCGVLMEIGSD